MTTQYYLIFAMITLPGTVSGAAAFNLWLAQCNTPSQMNVAAWSGHSLQSVLSGAPLPTQRVESCARSHGVAADVAARLNLSTSPGELRARMGAVR